MGGWTGEGKDTIIWDGTIRAKQFYGQYVGDDEYLKLDGSNANVNINIGTYDLTTTGTITTGDLLLTDPTHNYLFTNRTTFLALQSQTSGQPFVLETYSKDGDNTDNIFFRQFTLGTPASIANSEFFEILSQPTITTLFTRATGTGTANQLALGYNNTADISMDSLGTSLNDLYLINHNAFGGGIYGWESSGNIAVAGFTADTSTIISSTDGSGSLFMAGDLEIQGDLFFSGGAGSGLPFAEIYVADGSTAQSIATGTTYTKLTGFTTNGQSNNCTADATNDKITITKVGVYKIDCSISASSGTANTTFKYALFLNGSEQSNVHCHRKYGATGDLGASSMTGFIDVNSVPLDIDVRARHDNGSSVNITPTYMNLNCIQVGG